MGVLYRGAGGKYTDVPIISAATKPRKRKSATREALMRSPSGWYTVLGGKWCWVYRTKSAHRGKKALYYALLPGKKTPTPAVQSLDALANVIAGFGNKNGV